MLKKIMLALLVAFASCGLTLAAVVTLVKADDKTITVKEGDEEKKYDLEGVKFSMKGKDGDKEVPKESALKILTNEKSWGKAKLDVTVDGKKLTEIKFVGGGKKKKDDKADKN